MFAICEKTTGRILHLQSNEVVKSDCVAVDIGKHNESIADAFYLLQGALVPRPRMPDIPREGMCPMVLDLSFLMEGANVVVKNQDGDTMVVTDGELILTDPGRYEIDIEQSFPYHSMFERITVNG